MYLLALDACWDIEMVDFCNYLFDLRLIPQVFMVKGVFLIFKRC